MRKAVIALLLVIIACSCKTQQAINNLGPTTTLAKDSSLYIAVPKHPGRDSERSYEGSNFQTAEACMNAFRPYEKVRLGREPQNLEEALTSARSFAADYLVKPEIRVWEDNPTEWNGEPDVLDVDIEVFDVKSGKSVSRSLLKGKSRWMSLGDKPERMLIGYFEPYAAQLFGSAPAAKTTSAKNSEYQLRALIGYAFANAAPSLFSTLSFATPSRAHDVTVPHELIENGLTPKKAKSELAGVRSRKMT
jgi:hypothetical protein